MRLITTNFVQESATVITASSSNVNFPASNVGHSFRSKTWRSTGTFSVAVGTSKIDFKESGGGAQLTATLSSNTYTPATLATEIKTAMEIAGAATYTVTYSSTTGLWTIASDGAYLSLLNNTGTNQATNALKNHCGFANSDRTGALTYTGPTISIHSNEGVIFDLVTTEDINSVVLLWPKEDGIQLSASAVVKIQANATNVWSSPSVNQTLTINNTYETYSHYFSTAQSYRYWRVEITDPANANLYVNLGVVVLGMSESIDSADNGFKYNLIDKSVISRTDYGNEYIDEYPTIANLELNFEVMDYSDIQILEAAYIANGTRKSIFIALDSAATVYNKDHFSIYGKMESNFDVGHINYNLFKTSLKIRETL